MPKKNKTSASPKSQRKDTTSTKSTAKVGGKEDADLSMRALSIRQPWAEQIMRGEKVTEFRSMPTNIRGTVYIYASLGRYPKYVQQEIVEEVGFEIEELPRGLIIGTVDIVGCEELDAGHFGWELKNPKRLKKLLKPTQQPNPAWFYPFVSPSKGIR